MRAMVRRYEHDRDYERVGRFLLTTYGTGSGHVNWLQPRWEYMHYHPLVCELDLTLIGVWEAGGLIVGVVHPEHTLGTAYVQIDPEWYELKEEMLTYAEEHLSASDNGVRRLRVYINDHDVEFQRVAAGMGYLKGRDCEPMSRLKLAEGLAVVSLPAGFRLMSLTESNDLRQVHRVLWRGFNHQGDPREDGIGGRVFMQSAPNFRKDLNIVVLAPNGAYVSYCGMWYEAVHRVAYVEPVATDPEFRRIGLARAAVLEGVRRCADRGATVAYVGSDRPFYRSLGFRQVYNRSAWEREWLRSPMTSRWGCRSIVEPT